MWKHRDTPPHPEWISTKNVQSTGEFFGLVDSMHQCDDVDSESDVSLNEAAELAAEHMAELDTGADNNEVELMRTATPASTQWLATLYRRDRAYEKVKGKDE